MDKNSGKNAGGDTSMKHVRASVLVDRQAAIHEMIARRAYDLYESRGRTHGQDFDDWIQAENEFILPCRHDLTESNEAVILVAETPRAYTANEVQISVEPRQLIVSGERVVYSDGSKTRTGVHAQRLLLVRDLPAEVDPSRTTAVLEAGLLRVTMPKIAASGHVPMRAQAASTAA